MHIMEKGHRPQFWHSCFLLLYVLGPRGSRKTHGRIKVYFKKLPREKLEDNELEEPLEDDI